MAQYLGKKELLKISDSTLVDVNDLLTRDTYDEFKLTEKLKKFDKDVLIQLLKCAIQIAIVGAGKNSYGSIKHGGKEIELTEIFSRNNISYKNSEQSKLEDDELTPRRLVRLFRYQIQDFIKRTNKSSYLFRKYDLIKDSSMIHIVFPGAEHLVENEKEYKYLFEVYRNLDNNFEIKSFENRFNRVMIARGIIKSPLK
jgi:hypothetical protein